MGKKLLIKKKGKENRRAIEKDRNRFANKKSKFWFVRMREKQKRCLITSDLSVKRAFFDAKFI